ncbi:MAG: alpha/beta hydrolase [Desulfobacteraceae bacterium]|jgi:acetyl esterase/lipase
MKKNILKKFSLFIGILLLITLSCFPALSQEEINLYDGEIPNLITGGRAEKSNDAPFGKLYFQVVNPSIKIYLPPREKNTGIAVIICPGGSYSVLAYDHEGTTAAKRLAEEGITGIVLKYRLPEPSLFKNKETVPLQDAQRALIVVRKNASKWGINPDRVGIMGSSAGGHLASTAGTHFEKCYTPNLKNINVRPDFMILNYPVISFTDNLTHFGSRLRLIGEKSIPAEMLQLMGSDPGEAEKQMAKIPVPQEKILEFSNELHVTPDTPPAFIIHANDDTTVKIQNSILFIAALQKAGVKVDCFFYAKGGHGFGINNPTSDVSGFDSCIRWIKNL